VRFGWSPSTAASIHPSGRWSLRYRDTGANIRLRADGSANNVVARGRHSLGRLTASQGSCYATWDSSLSPSGSSSVATSAKGASGSATTHSCASRRHPVNQRRNMACARIRWGVARGVIGGVLGVLIGVKGRCKTTGNSFKAFVMRFFGAVSCFGAEANDLTPPNGFGRMEPTSARSRRMFSARGARLRWSGSSRSLFGSLTD
jgi:hypothetical protein